VNEFCISQGHAVTLFQVLWTNSLSTMINLFRIPYVPQLL